MENSYVRSYGKEVSGVQTLMTKVYLWMTMGLGMTALGAMVTLNLFESSPAFVQFYMGMGKWVLFGGIIALTLALNGMINRISFLGATFMYIVFTALMGMNIAPIALIYTQESIISTFLITALTFGGVSAFGYITKKDLSSIGSLCGMALWGIIIASVVNMFLQSSTMSYIVSYIGIAVFIGLTAWDTQKIKAMLGQTEGMDQDSQYKIALLGSMNIYLDFINLFLYLLRIFGSRRD